MKVFLGFLASRSCTQSRWILKTVDDEIKSTLIVIIWSSFDKVFVTHNLNTH